MNALRRLFSADTRTFLPALMDGLAVTVCSLPLWLAFLATSDKYTLRSEMLPPSGLSIVTMIGYVGLTGGLSVIAIRFNRRGLTKPPTTRSMAMTVFAVVMTLASQFALAAIFRDGMTLQQAWTQFASTGLLGIPTAIRMTAGQPEQPKAGQVDSAALRELGAQPGTYNSRGYRL